MILGMSTFTLVHVLISLIGMGSGLIAVYGLLSGKLLGNRCSTGNRNPVTLVRTVADQEQGSPARPSHKVGIISRIVLAIRIAALYLFHLAGKWHVIYVISALMALYLNCFGAVVQSFLKIPALHAIALNGNEPPFLVAQTIVLLAFSVLGGFATRRFRGVPVLAS